MIETPLRPRVDLNSKWEFLRRRVGRRWLQGAAGGGEIVVLPHSWNTIDTFQHGRRSYSGWGSYRRSIEIPAIAASDVWRLHTGGFYGIGDVWLDGVKLATIDGQYLGFSIDLESGLTTGPHMLGIRLDNRFHRNVLPGFSDPDFILHGGLAGGAWLEGLPESFFKVNRLSIDSREQDSGAEVVTIGWALGATAAATREVAVEWTVTDGDGHPVGAAPIWRGLQDDAMRSATIEITNPRCWSPADPAMYWAEGRLVMEGSTVDVVRIRFGITRAEFRPREGFFLDGIRVDLHGCNRHEAIPGFGNALPDDLQRRDALILKDLGCNFVRLSHYPQSPTFLDACDEFGIMVYSEIATWKSVRSARGWRRAARRQMRDLINRDRHHPSIIVWGMGNESRSRKAYLELRSIARELDPGRPVTYAENHLYRARRQNTVGIADVWGVNYELDVLGEACSSSRLENVLVSECCNHPESIRGNDSQELSQVTTVERDWELMADSRFVAGHAIWCLTDYATEHRNRFRRLPGLLDAWRRPKMAAELFRARYSKPPFVSLHVAEPGPTPAPTRFRIDHRAAGVGRASAELHVFTNCDTLRLARDGSMIAVLEGAIHHVLPLYGAFEEIIATGSLDGKVVQDRVRRYGRAERIHLRTAAGSTAPIMELDVEILDETSTVVGNWNGAVRITLEGPGRCHAYNEALEIVVARGLGRAYISFNGNHEAVVVTATTAGLSPGILSLHSS